MSVSTFQVRSLTGVYSLVKKSGLLETSFGRKLFASSYFFYKSHLEDPFKGLIRKRPELFRGGHILDIGANIGYTAVQFARAIDPGFKVFAFEPESFNFEMLQQTIRSHDLRAKVIPHRCAVGDHDGVIDLWLNEHHHGDHRVVTDAFQKTAAGSKYTVVPAITIDGFLESQRIATAIRFIKVDVQGYELPVCRGMRTTLLRNPDAVLAVEYMPSAMSELGFQAQALLDWFFEKQYHVCTLEKNGEIRNGLPSHVAQIGYADLIFSRQDPLSS